MKDVALADVHFFLASVEVTRAICVAQLKILEIISYVCRSGLSDELE
jgi:hypothetical protein